MHTSTAQDAHLDALASSDVETLSLFRRSPHPYLLHRDDVHRESSSSEASNEKLPAARTPARSSDHTASDDGGRSSRKRGSQSPSESGTEADDEGYTFVKALPAPPLRPRKGLRNRNGLGQDEVLSPLLTPTQGGEESCKYTDEYLKDNQGALPIGRILPTDEEFKATRKKYLKRRRNEIVRRTTETALLACIGVLAVVGCGCWGKLLEWHRAELATHAIVMVGVLGLYPLRLLIFSWRRNTPSNLRPHQRIHVPAAFDPAPVLYPAIVPVIISISLFASYQKPLLANIILGLAALPPQIIPFGRLSSECSSVHWLLSILPLFVSENTDVPSPLSALRPYKLRLPSPDKGLDPELMVSLFPLHQALLPPLYYLTTTSLLPTELHLLSIGLINLLLFTTSPQTQILKTLMWLGGVGLFVLCGKVLKWGVALARIPRWRFRRVGQVIRARQSFLQSLNASIRPKRATNSAKKDMAESDADEDEPFMTTLLQKTISLRVNTLHSARDKALTEDSHEPQSALETKEMHPNPLNDNVLMSKNRPRLRRNTLPALAAEDHTSKHRYSNRKRSKSIAQSYLSLTPTQAQVRKWVYAAYFYLIVVAIILGPIRYIISKYALHNYEPFGWAIGYLFGNIQRVRWEILNWNLDWWVPLPPMQDYDDLLQGSKYLAPAENIRMIMLGQANTRLLLCMYCVGTIVVGLLSVFSLSSVVEVDTRRKVFHGTMVAMLLPTIYIDPCFVALALGLVLSIFLLLDLIRASQLPPLSQHIASFLTPYVDGRDLRGPVVVSHIFLLIGCAIPLWLSLSGIERAGHESWQGWEVQTRDVSMVAGVVCVGMGDAAASLIGRRYGRRKWPWAGGKSLEGSLAFAVAVIIGLVFGKAWLHLGWDHAQTERTGTEWAKTAALVVGKSALCAAGASLNEAVLTGGNDNVIVPVVLWVLIRGVRL